MPSKLLLFYKSISIGLHNHANIFVIVFAM